MIEAIIKAGHMRSDLYEEMYRLEKDYWWHVSKRETVCYLLERYLSERGGIILDVGCGTGRILEELSSFGTATGVDSSPEALSFCKRRGLTRIEIGEADKLPFPDGSVSALTALDLLEHSIDDQKVAREFYRVLGKNGLIIITVPAYQWLWSYWDKELGHQRRYSKKTLSNVIREAGFVIEKISYLNMFILLPIILVRFIKSSFGASVRWKSDFIPVPHFVNWVLVRLHRAERCVLKWSGLPFGLSVVVVARKIER